jgi:hypothetical protein
MIDVKTKFVSVLVFTIEPDDLPEFAHEATLAVQRKAPTRRGFVEGIVMANESKTEALIVTQWESKHDWIEAQWDEDIGRTVAVLVEGTKSFDVRSFEPITIVRAS